MAYLTRDGVAIYYEVHGEGPAILLSHGFGATGRMWAPQLDMLKQEFMVIPWDMRGFGRTDSPADPKAYTEAETLADMATILDAVGARRAILGGHSMGGFMSLAFRAKHNDRVAGLLLCGTGPGFRKDAPRAAWNERVLGMASDFETRGLDGMEAATDIKSAEIHLKDHKSLDGLVKAARGMLTQRDSVVIDSLSEIDVPTFISVGSEDKGFLSGTEYLEAKIPGAERTVFKGAGHPANVDQPEEFNRVLAGFLQKHAMEFKF